jgi:hypothetical protein
MAQDTQNPQKRSQGDFAARAEADAYFADITVLEQNKGIVEDDILQALGTLNEKDDKIGACVVVLMPELVPTTADAPGPEYKVRATLQVIVSPLLNESANGTGKSAEQISSKLRQLFHRYNGGYGTWSFAGVEPIDRPGDVSYGVVFTRLGRDGDYIKLATPLLDPEEGLPATVTITHPMVGAAIWFTTDGSYPHPDNEAATLYSAPIDIAEATTLRAAAYKDGYQGSNVASANYGTVLFEHSDEFSNEFS